MVNCQLAESRQKAQAMIMAGLVYCNGKKIEKAGQMLPIDHEIFIKEGLPYVSRGGLKLEEALNKLRILVKGKVAADLGSSTGGFTDCLLQRGAKRVYAVDVDTRQLDWWLREDPRVVLVEKNARYLRKEDFPEALDIVTTDLSFISVLKVLPALREFLGEGILLSLIKPQFEVERNKVGEKGVVRELALHEEVLHRIIRQAEEIGFHVRGLAGLSIRGQKGNREFFIFWSLREKALNEDQWKESVREAVYDEKN